jgi:tRNA(Ile)-lysidine synthase
VFDLPPDEDPDQSIPVAAVVNLPPARERNALRALLARRGLPVPSSVQLEQLRAALRVARPDALTCVRWPGVEARVYRQRLYLMVPRPPRVPIPPARVSCAQPWVGPEGRLELVPGPGRVSLPESWARAGLELRFRSGGERLRKNAARHSVSLKHWFQETGIVPWMRDRIPLLLFGGEIVAVADLWGREVPSGTAGETVWQVRWTAHPPLT